jgi:hypothetical protein
MKIDRAGLVNVYDTLAQIKNHLKDVLHKYTAASLRKQLEVHADPITEQRTDVEKKYPKAFNEERETLCKEYASKDKDGKPLMIPGNQPGTTQYFIDPSRQSDFNDKLDVLRAKHKESIDSFEADVKRVNDFLKEEIDFPELKGRLKLSWFKDSVDQQNLEDLMMLIDADLDVIEAVTKAKNETK